MIRELTLNEMEEVSGGNPSAVAAVGAAATVVSSLSCTIARATANPVAVGTCIASSIVAGASGAYLSGYYAA